MCEPVRIAEFLQHANTFEVVWNLFVRSFVLRSLYSWRIGGVCVHMNVPIVDGGVCGEGDGVVLIRDIGNSGRMCRCSSATASPSAIKSTASGVVWAPAASPATPTSTWSTRRHAMWSTAGNHVAFRRVMSALTMVLAELKRCSIPRSSRAVNRVCCLPAGHNTVILDTVVVVLGASEAHEVIICYVRRRHFDVLSQGVINVADHESSEEHGCLVVVGDDSDRLGKVLQNFHTHRDLIEAGGYRGLI